jgi:hypothetical protein
MSAELSEFLAPWIAEHCAAAATQREAKAQRKKAEREAHQRARNWGLRRRQARKLGRNQARPSIT